MRTPTGRLPKHPRPGTKLGAVMLALWHAAQDTTRPMCPWITLDALMRATGATKAVTAANIHHLWKRGFVCRSIIDAPDEGEVRVYCLTDWGAAAAAQVFGPGPTAPEA